MTDLTYESADRLLGAHQKREIPCPLCSHFRKPQHRKLPCCGLMRVSHDRIVYHCQNCGAGGPLTAGFGEQRHDDRQQRRPSTGFRRGKTEPTPEFPDDDRRTAHLAQALWSQSVEPMGTETEAYWRSRQLRLPIPPSIRHLANHQGRPVMLAAVGLPLLEGDDWTVSVLSGVQRTFLNDGGQGRDKERGKRSLGQIKGFPCPVHVNPESLALVIGEGVEKTHALAATMNVDGWSTSGKSFLPHLAEAIPAFVETVTIIMDQGADKEVSALAERIDARGMEVRIV